MGSKKGFTLIELLLVVAIIGILAAIVIIAINPQKQLNDTKDAQRKTDMITILDAVYQYSIDNKGVLPNTIPGTAREICATTATSGDCVAAGLINLSSLTDNGLYVVAMPTDPTASTTFGTGYRIATTTSGNRVTVSSMGTTSLSVSR